MSKVSLAQLRRFVGRTDVYALQYVDSNGQVGWRPVREPLTNAVLSQHLHGKHTVGTYVVQGDQARTLVFDLDSGEYAPDESWKIRDALYKLGFQPENVGIADSGNKGRHLWVPFADWLPAADLRRVGRAVLAMSGVDCEVNPKQDSVSDLGNLIRLPAGVHQKTGRRNDFVTPIPLPVRHAVWQQVFEKLPPEQRARRSAPADERFPCMGLIQAGVTEGGRNRALFQLATMLRRHGVSDENVALVVQATNAKCDPPVSDRELESLLDSSRLSGPICDQLPASTREACGEFCIKEVRKGLQPRPGDVRHGGVGENVVVTISARDEDTVTLSHEDLRQAKGALRKTT